MIHDQKSAKKMLNYLFKNANLTMSDSSFFNDSHSLPEFSINLKFVLPTSFDYEDFYKKMQSKKIGKNRFDNLDLE